VYRHPAGVKTALAPPHGALVKPAWYPYHATIARLREYKIMFRGSMVAIVTPMRADGALDFEALARLVEFHIENGTDAIIAVGTTGESATLDFEEHIRVVRRWWTGQGADSGHRRYRRQLHPRGAASDPARHGGRGRCLPVGDARITTSRPRKVCTAITS
jgi:hypothetical protein